MYIDHETFRALRIEAGTAIFGLDITDANLPQEVNRDVRAISFVKGCYLGREIAVARLDRDGSRQQDARRRQWPVPNPRAARAPVLVADGKPIGTVTSSALSPGWSRGVVLGYVKTAHAAPGSALVATWDGGSTGLVVHTWPMRRRG